MTANMDDEIRRLEGKIDAVRSDLQRLEQEVREARLQMKRPLITIDSNAVFCAIYFLMLLAMLFMLIADPPGEKSHRTGWLQHHPAHITSTFLSY
jgi:hypothetical protein